MFGILKIYLLENKGGVYQLKFIDFFAGIGTARMGFEKAGHQCVYSVEWDKHKREQYKIIFGKEPEGSDICEVKGTDLPNADVWIAGFPCQDISIAGNKLGFTGKRSSLYFEVLRLLSEVNERNLPEYVLFENVKNFLSVNQGRDFFTALVSLDEVGYDAEWDLLNSKNFGVPQNRERVFIVGHNRNKCSRKVFPIRQNDETSDDLPRQSVSTNTIKARYTAVGSGSYVVENKQYAQGIKQNNNPAHSNDRIRRLTPKECMRLQGVDDAVTDKLIAAGISDSQLYRSAGDAMTVNVLYEIAKNMEVY
jgi:DNA (cytosine-5)-methyltransferase 1